MSETTQQPVRGEPEMVPVAAIRKQAPVLVKNLLDAPAASYDGYASCPLTTAYGKLLLAEFDYDGSLLAVAHPEASAA